MDRSQSSTGRARRPDGSRGYELPAPLSSLIGREAETSDVAHALDGWRLVTLTGAPGIGKTRLAIAVAHELRLDDTRFLELAALSEPGLVAPAAAAAFALQEVPGRDPVDALLAYLRERDALLVLDNCEHVLRACTQLVDVLARACPRLRVLATSREPLGIVGERVWPVPALSLPDPHLPLPPTDMVCESAAVRLFVERAGAVQPGFVLDDHAAHAVVDICRRLDGIPLAIELAAARVKMLTPTEIAWRLDDRFALLTSSSPVALPRHQTLRAALDWSHDLLSPPEQALLRRCSAFVDGFELEIVEAVCAGDGLAPDEVIEVLAALVAKSLVVADVRNDAARYRLLETIRAYAADRLEAAGEETATREAHARAFLDLAETAEPELTGRSQLRCLGRLEAERANLRCALEWSLSNSHEDWALRMAGALTIYWRVRCHFTEGRDLLAAALAAGEGQPPAHHAKALWGHGFLTMMAGDYPGALALLEESRRLYRVLGDRRGCARALFLLGNTKELVADPGARPMLDESRRLAGAEGDSWCLSHACAVAGFAHVKVGRIHLARPLFEESIRVARAAADQQSLRAGLLGLGSVALDEGDLDAAEELLTEAVTAARQLGEGYSTGFGLLHLGELALARGRYPHARRLLEEALRLMETAAPPLEIVGPLAFLARLSHAQGDLHDARRGYEQALSLAGDRSPVVLQWRADLALAEREPDDARDLFERAREAAQSRGDERAAARAQCGLGDLAFQAGDLEQAAALYREALDQQGAIRDLWGIASSLDAVAAVAAANERHGHAARLASAADTARDRHGFARLPWESARRAASMSIVREALPAEELEAAFAEGRALSVDRAVALACNWRRSRPASGWLSLSDAERDVAELVAEGLTNRAIAERLFISVSTVKARLSRAFVKLGVSRRSALGREIPARCRPPRRLGDHT